MSSVTLEHLANRRNTTNNRRDKAGPGASIAGFGGTCDPWRIAEPSPINLKFISGIELNVPLAHVAAKRVD